MRPRAPWAVLDVDLDHPTPALGSCGSANAVVLVFRRRGVVLGRQILLSANLPLTAREVAAIAAKAVAPAVADLLASGGEPVPFRRARRKSCDAELPVSLDGDVLGRVDDAIARRRTRAAPLAASVVICTRGRPDELRECLSCVRGGIPPACEIVVVDNGPDRETEAVVRSFPNVRYVAEPEGGLSRARNTGLRAAAGELVVFVDDDTRPEEGWLAALVQNFADDSVAVACGLVLPDRLATEAQVAFEHDLGFGGMQFSPLVFDDRFTRGWRGGVPVWNIGAGANMAVRRRSALQVGGFDERLGPGALGGCGEDSEFWRRILFSGRRIVYDPSSVVRHRHRESWDALERQAYGYSLGHVAALFAQYAVTRDRGDLFRAFAILPRRLLGRIADLPVLWLRGERDRLLWPEIRGYVSGLMQLRLAFSGGSRRAPRNGESATSPPLPVPGRSPAPGDDRPAPAGGGPERSDDWAGGLTSQPGDGVMTARREQPRDAFRGAAANLRPAVRTPARAAPRSPCSGSPKE